MNITTAFEQLIEFEKLGIPSVTLSPQNELKYMHNAPEHIHTLDAENLASSRDATMNVLPRHGDLLLSVEVIGKFRQASIFQYFNTTQQARNDPASELMYETSQNKMHAHGVKVRHRDGTMYQMYNICDHGFSPNVLDKC